MGIESTNGTVELPEDATLEEATLAEEQPAVETETREEKLAAYIQSRDDNSATDDSGEVEEVVAEEVATESEETPKPAEGPSAAMQAVARQHLPAELVALARDDEQLTEMLNLAQQQAKAEEPATEPEAEAYELTLPEDEFPEDDPVRKEFDKLKSHYEGQLGQLKEDMREMLGIAQSLRTDQEFSQQQAQQEEQRQFDAKLDEFGGAFGEAGKLDDAGVDLRTATFNIMQQLREKNPQAPIAELTIQAAQRLGHSLPEQPTVIKKAARKKLGGAPTPPAPKSPESREQMMDAFLDKLGVKS